ncbi:general secretion pathway protein GspB [Pseudoduganella violacea]|uniref:General secretion pathway protein B n=1 Tax=Pseudoduganella violacea TaxID=1715466 RepID=A0A7W5BB13_9BURK|nr:general secretion pathway protein GspB [Pseudoduganella violacea]MBB3119470.1 general secretion pathway protein B [Pseudoduganella violacea]
MSYILEALQKAQAERQLGEAPTIHAPTLERSAARTARNGKRPLVLALILMSAAVAGLLAMLLRSQPQPSAPPAPVAVRTPAPATLAAATPASAQAEFAVAPVSTAASAAPEPAASVPIAAAPAAAPVPVTARDMADAPKSAAKTSVKAGPAQAAVEEGGKTQAAVAQAGEPEERAQLLRELPEPIQRAIPPISMSGYMYSKNPADRLILIDKVLRREGEEVAPGLVLEKLQAKGAVFSFRGYRYRVPY